MDLEQHGSESVNDDDRSAKKRPREDSPLVDKKKVQVVLGEFAPLSTLSKEQSIILSNQQLQNVIEIDGSSTSSPLPSSPQKSTPVPAVIAQPLTQAKITNNNPTTSTTTTAATTTTTTKSSTSSGATSKSTGGQTTSKKASASGGSANLPQKVSSLIPNVFCPISSPTSPAITTTPMNEEINMIPPSDVNSKISSLSIKYNQEKDTSIITPKSTAAVGEKPMSWIVVGNVIKTAFGAHDFIAIATSRDEVHVFNVGALNVPTLPIICDASIADLILSTSSSYDSAKCMLCVITCNGNFSLWSLSPFKSIISQASVLPIIKKLSMPIKTPYSDNQTCSFHLSANGVLAAIVVAKSSQSSSTITSTSANTTLTTTIVSSAAALAAESENSVFIFNKTGMCWNKIIDPKRFGGTQFFLSALNTSATKGKKSFYSEVLVCFILLILVYMRL